MTEVRSVQIPSPRGSSLHLEPNNRVTLGVIRQSIFAVSLDSHTLGLHPPDNILTSRGHPPYKPLTCPRKWTITCTTPVPPSMPITVADYAVSQSIGPETFSLP